RHVLLIPQPPQPLLVDEQDAVEDAVLPHEVFGSPDLLLGLVLLVALGLVVCPDVAGGEGERADAEGGGRARNRLRSSVMICLLERAGGGEAGGDCLAGSLPGNYPIGNQYRQTRSWPKS